MATFRTRTIGALVSIFVVMLGTKQTPAETPGTARISDYSARSAFAEEPADAEDPGSQPRAIDVTPQMTSGGTRRVVGVRQWQSGGVTGGPPLHTQVGHMAPYHVSELGGDCGKVPCTAPCADCGGSGCDACRGGGHWGCDGGCGDGLGCWWHNQVNMFYARNRCTCDELGRMIRGCGDGRSCLCRFGYFVPSGNGGVGNAPFGTYSMVYPLNQHYVDPRDMGIYAAQGYGVPVTVPLAPVVEDAFNYSWGIPSSRLTPISRSVP